VSRGAPQTKLSTNDKKITLPSLCASYQAILACTPLNEIEVHPARQSFPFSNWRIIAGSPSRNCYSWTSAHFANNGFKIDTANRDEILPHQGRTG
jgi:hypothetical protein